jgi:hypothetical protein
MREADVSIFGNSHQDVNIQVDQTNQGQMTRRRQCLTCKNKGCVGQCRFTKPLIKRTARNIGELAA